jgi:hypothetical protein
MLYQRLHITFIGIVATLVDSVVVAEFAGYWLHRLLYGDRFQTLSRGHLIHHFLVYGPRQPKRAGDYHAATESRLSIANVGIEWLAPSAMILLSCWAVMVLLGVPPIYRVIALCTLLGWPILMFSYLHDRMHTENFWMSKAPLLKAWFFEGAQAARHSTSQCRQPRLHGHKLRHRVLFFRSALPDHGEASPAVRLDRVQDRHRALRSGPGGARLTARPQQALFQKDGRKEPGSL